MSTQNSNIHILALGDSLTAGYGLKRDESFPAQLEQLLSGAGKRATVLNGGVSGNTTGQALARLPRLLGAQDAKLDLAIVALGANDMIRGVPADTMRANLDAILTTFADCRIPVLLAGMLMPSFLGADFARRYNAVFPELAAKHDASFYPFFLKSIVGDPTLLLADRVHPSARAVRTVAENILPTVVDAIHRAAPASKRSVA